MSGPAVHCVYRLCTLALISCVCVCDRKQQDYYTCRENMVANHCSSTFAHMFSEATRKMDKVIVCDDDSAGNLLQFSAGFDKFLLGNGHHPVGSRGKVSVGSLRDEGPRS